MQIQILWSLIFVFLSDPRVEAKTVSLTEVVRLAQSNDHRNEVTKSGEAALEYKADQKFADYLPHLQLEAIDSTGFAGSSSGLRLSGIAASPYREGPAVDLTLKQTLWDFGKTASEVDAANSKVKAQKMSELEMNALVAREVTHGYFRCVYAKSSVEHWSQMESKAKTIFNEVSKFIKTGQRSVVDRYLAKSQVDEYARRKSDAENAYRYSLLYLEKVTAASKNSIDCPFSKELDRLKSSIEDHPEMNLTLKRIQIEAEASDSLVKVAQRSAYPKLVGLGSVGFLSDTRLVNKRDYEVAVGLTFPLYEGGAIRAKVHEAESLKEQKSAELKAQEEEVSRLNLALNERIETEKSRVRQLEQENQDAVTAFSLAESRYKNLEGTLIDLRETLKILVYTGAEIVQSQVNLHRYSADKAILNGQVEY